MQKITLGALASALVLVSPAFAEPNEPALAQTVVSFSGIDMTSEAGADRALELIRDAAREVCDVGARRHGFAMLNASAACVDEAVARAVDDLGSLNVTARYYGARQYALRGARS